MASIQFTDKKGNTSIPNDLKNLSYDECINQLDLFEQGYNKDFEPDRQFQDYLVLNYPDGFFEIYEII